MRTVLPDMVSLGTWTLLFIPFLWGALIRIWDQVLGDRDFGANLTITGLVILWTVALSLWV